VPAPDGRVAAPDGLVPIIAAGLKIATPGHDRMMFSDCLNEH